MRIRKPVTAGELASLSGKLAAAKTFIQIERHVDGEESYRSISKTMEEAILESSKIADRILYDGLEKEEK